VGALDAHNADARTSEFIWIGHGSQFVDGAAGSGVQVACEVSIERRSRQQLFQRGARDQGAANSTNWHEVSDRASVNGDAHWPSLFDLAQHPANSIAQFMLGNGFA
jgi:hypothetical protein